MATTTQESGPLFSRVVERGTTSSWRAAAPAVVILVIAVIALAYLASKVTSYSQQLATARQESQTSRTQLEQTQKRTADLERDLNLARDPGRTTVLLESAKGSKAWAAATWGEGSDGKSWVRVMAYGLQSPPEGKEFRAWLEPQSGAPADAGKLDPAQDGSAYTLGQNLPAVDQGKRLVVTLEDANAKQPGQVVMSANLPRLKPTQVAAAAPATGSSTAGTSAQAGSATTQNATPPPDAAAGQKAGGTKTPAEATK